MLCYGKGWSRDMTATLNCVSVGSMTVEDGNYSIVQQPMGKMNICNNWLYEFDGTQVGVIGYDELLLWAA